jgi:hypothetical protein
MAAAREMGSEGRGMDGWRTHASELSPGHSSRGGASCVVAFVFCSVGWEDAAEFLAPLGFVKGTPPGWRSAVPVEEMRA